ncbi:MAG TPA: hypothetical protein DHV28_10150 [Ignavibacteriales bacterium]|nr:hypothetical protein [Ignavibacteriales bacterium]
MFGFDKIDLSFSFNSIYFFIGLILLGAYSYYVYRFTLPPVLKLKRFLLTLIRSLALVLLLFIFFEPVLTLTKKNFLTPLNLFFFDNSKSITINDGSNRINMIKNLIEQTKNFSLTGSKEIFSFGSEVNPINEDSLNNLNFSESNTDFAKIFSSINDNEANITSITIISDGVITEGFTPIYSAEKIGIPVFTVGIGDSTKKNDVEIKNIINNEFIYAETPTTILATILNKGYSGKTSQVSLFEGPQLIEQKNLVLNAGGVNSVSFDYTPKQSGEKKLSIKASNQADESNYVNNQKVFYVNVLSNKINVLLLAGSPSADLTFIQNSLSLDKNLKVNTLTQIAAGNFLEQNPQTKLDSADIIFMIEFPNNFTGEDFLNRLYSKLENQNTPFFILLSEAVDLKKLNRIANLLPFSVQMMDKNYLQVQPDLQLSESTNPILKNNLVNEWNNLPPISQPVTSITIKPESKVLAKVRINNQPRSNPLIVSRSFGSKRSIAVIGKDIWKWKLQTATKNLTLFDNFIFGITRWLNAPDDQKKVKIKTSKKIYSSSELVEFSAQVYDDSYNPVSDADVKIQIKGKDVTEGLDLASVGGGLYEGSFSSKSNGDFIFTGSASISGKLLGEDKGSFNIGDLEIEMIDSRMNYEFLNLLASQTNGKYYNPDQYQDLLGKLNKLNADASKEKLITSEIRLWSDEWLLIIVILLFATEWFIRKRAGML